MSEDYRVIQELLNQRADLNARLALIPYDGSPEVKEIGGKRYLYIRKRVAGRITSTYVDVYSDELYQALLRGTREARQLRKEIRKIEKGLAANGFIEGELSKRVLDNIDFARANMKASIYDQAVLEGVATTFPQTEEIIENGKVSGMTATDVQKILNLKHAWEFILNKDVLQTESGCYLLCHIARLVNEGFFDNGGRIRGVPVTIGGTSYVPPLPIEIEVKDRIKEIASLGDSPVDTAVKLSLYVMRTQIFLDGNKRAAILFANHYLIAHGDGLLVIPEKHVSEFKSLLVAFYESNQEEEISGFMKSMCWRNF